MSRANEELLGLTSPLTIFLLQLLSTSLTHHQNSRVLCFGGVLCSVVTDSRPHYVSVF